MRLCDCAVATMLKLSLTRQDVVWPKSLWIVQTMQKYLDHCLKKERIFKPDESGDYYLRLIAGNRVSESNYIKVVTELKSSAI